MERMRAVAYVDSLPIADPSALRDVTLPRPAPREHDLLVAIRAVSVNPVDTKVRMRRAGTEDAPVVLGWDAAGEVIAVGDAVTLFRPGDRVWYAGDLTRAGSNAELQLVDERIVGPMPSTLSFAEAAALPLTALTAWELLFDRLEVAPRERAKGTSDALLIVGAAGGVGSIMVQLARKLTALRVIGTVTRPESGAWLGELGVHGVVRHDAPIKDGLVALGIEGVRYVASLTHTERYFAELVDALAPQGKLALIDDPTGPLDVRPLKQKSLSLHWELMFTRSLFKTSDMQQQHTILKEVAALVDQGAVRTTLKEHFGTINAANLARAHALLESGKARGKIVLEGF